MIGSVLNKQVDHMLPYEKQKDSKSNLIKVKLAKLVANIMEVNNCFGGNLS